MNIYRCRSAGRYRRSDPQAVSIDTRTELLEEHKGKDGLRAKTDPIIEIKTQTGSVQRVPISTSDELFCSPSGSPASEEELETFLLDGSRDDGGYTSSALGSHHS
jgi:hypothetical protein